MNKILIDTNVLIFLDKNNCMSIDDFICSSDLYISDITFIEFNRGLKPTEVPSKFVSCIKKIPFDYRTKMIANAIEAQYSLSINDAIIAATAIANQLPLFTLDKAFNNIKDLHLYTFDFY